MNTVTVHPGPATDEILTDLKLFGLLMHIARRVKMDDGVSLLGLEIGEALIVDSETGLSRQEYRTRLEKLKELGFSTTRATNRGTIVRLVNTSVCEPFIGESNHQTNQRATSKQPPSNQPKEPPADDSKPHPRLPTTVQAKRIATLFKRRETTHWSEKEVKAFKAIGEIDLQDLELIERYYAEERKKGDKEGIHRRDLCTFLNNFPGELDRARQWQDRNPSLFSKLGTANVTPVEWPEFLKSEGYKPARYESAPPSMKAEFKAWLAKRNKGNSET